MSVSNEMFREQTTEFEQFIYEEEAVPREEDYEQVVNKDSVNTESSEGANE